MISYISYFLTLAVVGASACFDAKYRRVPNYITFPAMVIGLLLAGFPFTKESYIRLFALLIIFLLGQTRLMGMGDLKMIMAVAAWRGYREAWWMFLLGVLIMTAFCFLTEPRQTAEAFHNVFRLFKYRTGTLERNGKEYPFAVFLALGYLWICIWRAAV